MMASGQASKAVKDRIFALLAAQEAEYAEADDPPMKRSDLTNADFWPLEVSDIAETLEIPQDTVRAALLSFGAILRTEDEYEARQAAIATIRAGRNSNSSDAGDRLTGGLKALVGLIIGVAITGALLVGIYNAFTSPAELSEEDQACRTLAARQGITVDGC